MAEWNGGKEGNKTRTGEIHEEIERERKWKEIEDRMFERMQD
jgi:hypothetical protein